MRTLQISKTGVTASLSVENNDAVTVNFIIHRKRTTRPHRLYSEIIPDIIKRGHARELTREGKLHDYQFTASE